MSGSGEGCLLSFGKKSPVTKMRLWSKGKDLSEASSLMAGHGQKDTCNLCEE
jgi:hypothetical protein